MRSPHRTLSIAIAGRKKYPLFGPDSVVPEWGLRPQRSLVAVRARWPVRSVARAALPDVLLIAVHGTAGTRTGTGFVIRSDRSGAYALTTAGTLGAATADQATITSPIDGRSHPATAVKVGKGSPGGAADLAIVRFAAKGLKALR